MSTKGCPRPDGPPCMYYKPFQLGPDLAPLFVLSGETERECVHAAVPLRRLLLLSQTEGARVQEHHVDLGVRRPEAQGQDRQLHPHLLRRWTTSCHSGMSITIADRKSQVRKCLGFFISCFIGQQGPKISCEKPKHCLTWDFLSALSITWETKQLAWWNFTVASDNFKITFWQPDSS